jgi:hypothetical protein
VSELGDKERAELIALRRFRETVENFGPVKAANRRAAMWADQATAETRKRVALVEALRKLADEWPAISTDDLRKVLDEHAG